MLRGWAADHHPRGPRWIWTETSRSLAKSRATPCTWAELDHAQHRLSCEGPGLAAGARPPLPHNVLVQQTWLADTGLLQECGQQIKGSSSPFSSSTWNTVIYHGSWALGTQGRVEQKEPIKSQIPGERMCNKHKGEIQRDLPAWAVVNPWWAWAVLFHLFGNSSGFKTPMPGKVERSGLGAGLSCSFWWRGLHVNDCLKTGKTHKPACVSSPRPSTCFSCPYHPGS